MSTHTTVEGSSRRHASRVAGSSRYPLRLELWSSDPDGDEDLWLLSRGHHNPRRFLQHVIRHVRRELIHGWVEDRRDRDRLAWLLVRHGQAAVEQRWLRAMPPGRHGGSEDWGPRYEDANGPGPGVFPVTRVCVDYEDWAAITDPHMILAATSNPVKLDCLAMALTRIGIGVCSPIQLALHVDEETEAGLSVTATVQAKALVYAAAAGRPALGLDLSLQLAGLPDADQPGTQLRRIPGRCGQPTDAEVLVYYQQRLQALGGTTAGRWDYALCLAGPAGVLADTVARVDQIFTATSCAARVPGYPLASLQIDPVTGRYLAEARAEWGATWQATVGDAIRALLEPYTTVDLTDGGRFSSSSR